MFSINLPTGWINSRPFLLLFAFLLAIVLLASWQVSFSAADEQQPFPVTSLPEEALSAPLLLSRSTAKLAGEQAKMDSALAQLVEETALSTNGAADLALASALRLEDDQVQVRVLSSTEELTAAEEAVLEAGGVVTVVSELEPELQAWIPVAELAEVAANSAVAHISQPAYVVPLDSDDVSATTEGLTALNAPEWHAAGERGAGAKIAIIDGGFSGYPGLLGSDLPFAITAKNFVDGESDTQVNGGSKHGTACAEIAYDIAPDAQFFLIKIATNLDLQQAVNYAVSQGVDVISTSVGWYNLTPGDGTGQFADLANLARSNGIIWLTAAGNDREAHWGGLFSSSDDDDFHEFDGQEINYFGLGNGDAYLIPSGFLIRVYLRWDDWTAVNQDYDLLVVAWNGSAWELVGSSTRSQSGLFGQKPTEDVIGFTTGSTRPYGFVIERVNSGRNVNLELFAPDVAPLDEIVFERSLPNLADVGAVVTIGAVDALSPHTFQAYSSQGPTNGPGGTASGGLMKPNLTAYSGVSTESYGYRGFGGTSASTPHAAGAAALVRGAYPQRSVQQVQNLLQGRAIDMGAPGRDNMFGYGRLFLGDPPDGHALTVNLAGDGSGTVTGNGINCFDGAGADCTQNYVEGTEVALVATADSGSSFTGWSGGGCSGTGSCLVTMSKARSVTATFTLDPPDEHALTVNLAGDGSGTVTGNGINCFDGAGADCTQNYVEGTEVTLVATADSGSSFTGWSGGGCSGTGSCLVTMSKARSVTATFTLDPPDEHIFLPVSLKN